MKRNLSYWQLGGFIFTAIGGVLLHFLYDWTNKSVLIAPFSGVNESTWEHMKLLYFPIFMFAIIQSRFFKERKDFWCVKLIGITAGLIAIPILFYTYNGAFGKSPDWLNITIFFISAAIAFILENWIFKNNSFRCKRSKLAFLLVCIIGALFVVFTFNPPQIPLFQDPLTDGFGV